METARKLYRDAGAAAARALGLPAPQGSTFLFVDVESALDERGLEGFLEDCFEDGVLVAPGASAGRDYGAWIRLCYTAAPPDQVERAVAHLARRLGSGPQEHGPRLVSGHATPRKIPRSGISS